MFHGFQSLQPVEELGVDPGHGGPRHQPKEVPLEEVCGCRDVLAAHAVHEPGDHFLRELAQAERARHVALGRRLGQRAANLNTNRYRRFH